MKFRVTKGFVGLAFSLVAGLSAKPVYALGSYPFAIPCSGCSNPTIINTIREGYGNQDSWYVYDLNGRRLRYYYKVGTSRGQYNIQEAFLDAKTQAYWNDLMEFYDRNHNSLSLDIRVAAAIFKSSAVSPLQPPSAADGLTSRALSVSGPSNITAWDAVSEGVYRQQVVNYLNSQSDSSAGGIFARAAELVGSTYAKITTIFGGVSRDQLSLNIQALSLTVTVAYPDGSSQRYAWDPLNHTWAYIPNTSIDSSGNTIPDGPSDVAGQNGNAKIYAFPNTPGGSTDVISWFQRVSLFNVSAPNPSTPTIIACVTTGSGGSARTTCTRQR